MSHYYLNDDSLKTEIKELNFIYRDQKIKLYTDYGVFSKDRVDYGSRVLLDTVQLDSTVKRVLDVGCGYGAIGISLASCYKDISFDLVDVNLRAISLANQAISYNHLSNVQTFESDVYENVKDKSDVIMTNPPIRAGKSVVTKILTDAYQHLNINGAIYVVIQKKQGAPSAKKCLEETFGNCEILKRDKGYYILYSVKRSA